MTPEQLSQLDWGKGHGLLPVVVQHVRTGQVLMMAFMNQAALEATQSLGRVTFYSRNKQRLWTKGETSGNFLKFVDAAVDCDNDAILILAEPAGPTCHTGTVSCFGDDMMTDAQRLAFLGELEHVIAQRIADKPEGSYTARIWAQGPTRMAQKVGEEGVEVALAAVTQEDDRLIGESADLLYHLTLLLKSRDLSLAQVIANSATRRSADPKRLRLLLRRWRQRTRAEEALILAPRNPAVAVGIVAQERGIEPRLLARLFPVDAPVAVRVQRLERNRKSLREYCDRGARQQNSSQRLLHLKPPLALSLCRGGQGGTSLNPSRSPNVSR
jgi:phosphoribosyl-AMP cyclohydrolase / phosphoribosyl-ATP pyrophosphohydrolase